MRLREIRPSRWVSRAMWFKGMGQILCAVVLVLCLVVPALAGKKRTSQKKTPAKKSVTPEVSPTLEQEAMKYLGVKYRTGGSNESGVDCSGFVRLVYQNFFGVQLPHQSSSIYQTSGLSKVSLDDLMTGDLVFFTPSHKSKRINHVGIYLSEGNFIHAGRRTGVVVSSLDNRYWRSRIMGAKRMAGLARPETGEAYDMDWASPMAHGQLFSTSLSSLEQDFFSSSPSDGSPWRAYYTVHPMGLELGYVKAFEGNRGELLQISFKQDTLLFWDSVDADAPAGMEGANLLQGDIPSFALVQEVRVGSDLRPFEWLRLTPSLSYFNYHGALEDTGLPRTSMGLNVSLGSETHGWFLSTGFRYASLISGRGFSSEEGAPTALDMSLTFTQRLSNSLLISLTGAQVQRFGTTESNRSDLDGKEDYDRRFSVMFNFTY